jgi:epsilon-lactone hydrolase
VTSLALQALNVGLRLVMKPQGRDAERMRARMGGAGDAAPPREAVRREVAGRPVWTLGAGRTGVLYVHGGAYVAGVHRAHWWLVRSLVRSGAVVDVPSYGLAPEHDHRQAHAMLRTAYEELAARVDRVVVAGDSAGGALALVLAQQLLADGGRLPDRVALIAPWLDAALEGDGVAEVEARDPWLSRAGLVEAARAFSGGDPMSDPGLSPLHGPVEGLPPTSVWVGTRDLFLPDCQRFSKRARAAGVRLDLHVTEGAPHVHPLLPVPEGRRAVRQLVSAVHG